MVCVSFHLCTEIEIADSVPGSKSLPYHYPTTFDLHPFKLAIPKTSNVRALYNSPAKPFLLYQSFAW